MPAWLSNPIAAGFSALVAVILAAATFASKPARERATWALSEATRPCMGARQL